MNLVLRRAAISYIRNNARSNQTYSAVAGDHSGGYKLWKKLSLFVAFPAIGLGMVNAYLGHVNDHHEPPPFVPYEYLRVRTKRFPWGDGTKTLFHNPHLNPLPTGYEHDH